MLLATYCGWRDVGVRTIGIIEVSNNVRAEGMTAGPDVGIDRSRMFEDKVLRLCEREF